MDRGGKAPLLWTGVLNAFMEPEGLEQGWSYSLTKKALNYFCMICSSYLHFLQNRKHRFFVQAASLSKGCIFLPHIS